MSNNPISISLRNAIILILIAATTALAQATGPSVMIYTVTQPGTDAEAMSHYVRDQIAIGLEKYPCVDEMDEGILSNLIGWERMQQLLGQDPSDEALKDLAGAVGARYLIVIKTTILPNGTVYTNVRILDTKTHTMIANRDGPPVGPKDGIASSDALVAKVMQDLANILKGECEEHWAGTISFKFQLKTIESRTTHDKGGGDELNKTAIIEGLDNLEDIKEVFLQPISQGSDGLRMSKARVVHRFEYRYERSVTGTSTVRCREPGRNSEWREATGTDKNIISETGEGTEIHPVWITLNGRTGEYEISVSYGAVKTTGKSERNGIKGGCKPKPFSEVSSDGGPGTEAYTQSGSFKITGRADPQKPDTLSGNDVTGDLEVTGQTTIKWDLRRVKPKTRK